MPGDEPRGPGAAAPALDGGRGRGPQRRVRGEPQVVVGGEEEDAAAVQLHLRVGGARERAEAAAEPGLLERGQLGLERLHTAVMPAGSRSVNLEGRYG